MNLRKEIVEFLLDLILIECHRSINVNGKKYCRILAMMKKIKKELEID